MNKLDELKKKAKRRALKLEKTGEKSYLGILDEVGVSRPYQRILTGILSFDYLIGGLKPGTVLEFSGEENAGKSTLVWKIIENIQNIYNKPAIHINDVEGTSSDEEFLDRFKLLKPQDIIFNIEPKIENYFNELEELADYLDIAVLDSVAVMSSVNDRDLEKSDMGKTAQTWSRGWKRVYDFVRKGMVILAINQVRDNLDPYASSKNGAQTTGGRALRHAKSAQIHLKKESKSKAIKKKNFMGEEEISAWETVIEVQKNKQGSAFKKVSTYLWTDPEIPETFDVIEEAITFGINYGVITRNSSKGSKYTFTNMLTGEIIKEINGRDALTKYFYETPLHFAFLKISVYRHMFNDKFFYGLYDKILLTAKADVFGISIKYGAKVDSTEEKLLEKFKKDMPIEVFFEKKALKELKEKYGEPWTWGALPSNGGGEDDEKTS
ncbi:hypothetical protein [uncultured Cetobacterium sp.]|uniref:hypothetical protein n=1 Tax=uncultured Cetobacterium sp. TaxID=527638 RepID=UPI0026329D5B|nr:hypothetical protein [uncultured Cetobacterium sp.]